MDNMTTKIIREHKDITTENGTKFSVSITVDFQEFGELNEESKRLILGYISEVSQSIYMDSASILRTC